jgi:hopanoid biosynthesis associated protein HpnK
LKQLVITADDFGAALAVNEAVEAAHRGGVLTATSLMVAGPAAGDAIARARRLPSLRVGLHLVLVEGTPTLPASKVGRLLDARGRLRSDLVTFGAAIAFSRGVRRELAAEIKAQFAAFRDSGLALDHANGHKHFHLHPVVAALLTEIGARFGLRAVRVPLEPRRVLRNAESRTPWSPAYLTGPFARVLRRRVRAVGLLAADHVFGLQWSGQMTRERLCALVRQLPEGLNEIYLHPATGPYAGSAPGYRYREELEALMAPAVIAACHDPAVRTGGFSDFLTRRSPADSSHSPGAGQLTRRGMRP